MRLITLTNDGYIEYTQNLLNSSNNVGINNIEVFCVGKKSYRHFNKQGLNAHLISNNFFSGKLKFLEWRTKNFNKLMFEKLTLIYKSLIESQKVLYIDGDIVFLKNFLAELNNHPIEDIVGQWDYNPTTKASTLCAGFMVINNTQESKNLFNPKFVPKTLLDSKFHFDDQKYINKNLNSVNYEFLDIKKYPNGAYFYENYKNLDPSIIHFNYLIGDEKKIKMKEMGYWYL